MPLDTEQKLEWAGLSTGIGGENETDEEVDQLEEDVGDWSTFADDIAGLSSYSELNDYLVNQAGFTQAEADAFVAKIQQNFDSFSAFKNHVANSDSYEEFQTAFDTGTGAMTVEDESGATVAGIEILEGGGVTRAGVEVSETTIEYFAPRHEFSETTASTTPPSFSVSNFTVTGDDAGQNTAYVGNTMTVSVDVTESNGVSGRITLALAEDGVVTQEDNVRVSGGSTQTVSFDMTKNEYTSVTVAVNGVGNETLIWSPRGL